MIYMSLGKDPMTDILSKTRIGTNVAKQSLSRFCLSPVQGKKKALVTGGAGSSGWGRGDEAAGRPSRGLSFLSHQEISVLSRE